MYYIEWIVENIANLLDLHLERLKQSFTFSIYSVRKYVVCRFCRLLKIQLQLLISCYLSNTINNTKTLILQNSIFWISLWHSVSGFFVIPSLPSSPHPLSFSFNSNDDVTGFATWIINPFFLGHKNTYEYHLWMVKTAKKEKCNLHNIFCTGLIILKSWDSTVCLFQQWVPYGNC